MNGLSISAPLVAMGLLLGASTAQAQTYAADVPDSVKTPDVVETGRLGTLKFFDGMPDDETVRKVYDNIDFSRGVEAFLSGIPAASIYGLCHGMEKARIPAHTIGITENLLDARSLFLTAQSTTVYIMACLDLKQGPVVMEVAPGILGGVDDSYFRWNTDVGITGPDQGRGGRYLFLPPHYDGPVPPMGFHVVKTRTNMHWLFARAFVTDAGIEATVAGVKASMKIYPLSEVKNSPEQAFVNYSGKKMNTVHANDVTFFDELNAIVQNEPADAFDPEIAGLFASIGIKKGVPFKPDERMQKLLTDAAAVGNATVRAITFRPRDRDRFYFYPDRQWYTSFAGGSHVFLDNGARGLDDRAMFHYSATGITPAMASPQVGTGSVYAFTPVDATGAYLDGGKTYKVTLPQPIPAKNFWSFVVYSTQHRSMLETDQRLAGLDSTLKDVKPNKDGSYTIWFGPSAPKGKEGNWVQTMPDKGFMVILRLYGPLKPWFDKSWKPGDLEIDN